MIHVEFLSPKFKVILLAVGVMLSSSACVNPFYLFKPDSEKLVSEGWADRKKINPEPLYCYKTLGERVCYTEPKEGADNLSGYYGPSPEDHAEMAK